MKKVVVTGGAGFIGSHLSLKLRDVGFDVLVIDNLSTSDDDDVSASLSILIPQGAVIIDAALIAMRLATSAHGDVALEVHNAAIADDAASGGTEIVGADTASNVSSPDQDCDCSSDGAVGEATTIADLKDVDRTGAVSYFHVCAKEDLSSMTGSPQVGVYLRWAGPAAAAI